MISVFASLTKKALAKNDPNATLKYPLLPITFGQKANMRCLASNCSHLPADLKWIKGARENANTRNVLLTWQLAARVSDATQNKNIAYAITTCVH